MEINQRFIPYLLILHTSLSYSLDNLIETDTFPTLSTGNLKKVLVTQNGKTKTYTSKKKNS